MNKYGLLTAVVASVLSFCNVSMAQSAHFYQVDTTIQGTLSTSDNSGSSSDGSSSTGSTGTDSD